MDLQAKQLMQKVAAEMVGTFALVFVGCGAIMVNAQSGVITHSGVGLVFGAVIMVMIYATGHISGAHFNPVVTIAFASVRRFPWREIPFYVVGQIVAAIVAAKLLEILIGPVALLGATVPAGSVWQAFVLESVLTFFLMFVIAAVATDSRAEGQMAGLAIGGTVALAAIFGGPISGASMNPARSLGPALVNGDLSGIWIYCIAPLLGAVAGAQIYRAISACESEEESNDAAGCC